MKKLLLVLLYLISFNSIAKDNLNVYYNEIEPYVKEVNGFPTGIPINILNLYALNNDIALKYIKIDNITHLINLVESDTHGIGVGAISINHDRLSKVNFSLPYRVTSSVLAYKQLTTYEYIIKSVGKVIYAFLPFVSAILIISILLMISKMKFIDALWMSLAAGTTVGFGDIVPKTNTQKLITGSWMIISMYFLSIFTAVLTTTMHNNYEHTPINVGVLVKSEGYRICKINKLNCISFENYDTMFQNLEMSIIDSIILDKEVLLNKHKPYLKYTELNNSLHSIISNKNYKVDDINMYIEFK